MWLGNVSEDDSGIERKSSKSVGELETENTERSKWLDGSIGNTGGRTEIAEGRPTLFVEWLLATETQEWKRELSIGVCSGDEPVLGLLVDICLRELEIEFKRHTKRLERYQLEFVLLEVARGMKGLET